MTTEQRKIKLVYSNTYADSEICMIFFFYIKRTVLRVILSKYIFVSLSKQRKKHKRLAMNMKFPLARPLWRICVVIHEWRRNSV